MEQQPDPDSEIRTADLPARTLWRSHFSAPILPLRWEALPPSQVGELLPRYEVLSLLGRGGMGAVYKARDRTNGMLVAVKLLPLELGEEETFRRRFLREAHTMAHLQHPGILTALDYGETPENLLFIAMQFMEGGNLHERILARSLSPADALRVVEEICAALAYAHEEGIIHRDIKPSNVLLDLAGAAKLADFGLAKPTSVAPATLMPTTGNFYTTREYAAPEVIEEGRADQRSDIYSLGILLYEALCRQLPRGQFTPASQRAAVDSRVDEVIGKAIQSDPELRYATAREMLEALRSVQAAPVASPGAPPKPGSAVPKVDHPWGRRAGLKALVLGAATLGTGIAWFAPRNPSSRREQKIASPPSKLSSEESPWRDWLRETTELPEPLVRTGEGIRLRRPEAKEFVKLLCGPALWGHAVRIRYSVDGSDATAAVRPIVQSSEKMETYISVYRFAESWQVFIRDKEEYWQLRNISRNKSSGDAERTVERAITPRGVQLTTDGTVHGLISYKQNSPGRPGFVGCGRVLIREIHWRALKA